jgi:hypothetical protein
MFAMEALRWLENAGFRVEPAEGVPGLFNVEGLARDLTVAQVTSLAQRHGTPFRFPAFFNPQSGC